MHQEKEEKAQMGTAMPIALLIILRFCGFHPFNFLDRLLRAF